MKLHDMKNQNDKLRLDNSSYHIQSHSIIINYTRVYQFSTVVNCALTSNFVLPNPCEPNFASLSTTFH